MLKKDQSTSWLVRTYPVYQLTPSRGDHLCDIFCLDLEKRKIP